MKKIILFLFILLISASTHAQRDSLQKQINRQVWKPFIAAFNAMDTDAFMSVHSLNMTRVIRDAGIIYDYDTYYESNKKNDLENAEFLSGRSIELRFLQRIAANNRAFETGYFKVKSEAKDGQEFTAYGKFLVTLTRENNVWKIMLDADAKEKTNEKLFLSAKPLE